MLAVAIITGQLTGGEPHANGVSFALRTVGEYRQSDDSASFAARGLGPSRIESNRYLRAYVGHLRQKLENDLRQPKYILTETGVGCRFEL